MSADPRISDLLLAWEEAQARGQDLTAQELCRQCPELAAGVKERIGALQALTPVLDLAAYAEDATPQEPAPVPLLIEVGSLPGYELLKELGAR